jgi:hypothetical protein
MNWLAQETNTTCGQTCAAMIAGLSWSEGVAAVGRKGATRYRHVVVALNALGFTTSPVTRVSKRTHLPFTGTALVKFTFKGRRLGHYVVLHDGDIYDPSNGVYDLDHYLAVMALVMSGKPTSFVVVHRRALAY